MIKKMKEFECIRLFRTGMDFSQIAKELDINRKTVRRIVRRHEQLTNELLTSPHRESVEAITEKIVLERKYDTSNRKARAFTPEVNQRMQELLRQLTHYSKYIPKRRRPTMASLKEKIAELNLLIELDINNKSYQEVKGELIKDIAQLDLTITELLDKVAHPNKVAEVLFNLNNSDPGNRRLARYDYAKINLTSAIKLKQVEKEIEGNQNSLTKWIDDYNYKVRSLENFVSILDNTRNQNITKLKTGNKIHLVV